VRSCSVILAIGLAALLAGAPAAHAQTWAERLATGAFEELRAETPNAHMLATLNTFFGRPDLNADFHDIPGPVPTADDPAAAGFYRSSLGSAVEAALRPDDTPVLVLAYRADQPPGEVAYDRILLRPGEQLPLYLPSGSYRLIAHQGDGAVIGHFKRARVNGTELAYIERGQGEPVVLIHGFMWDYRVWAGPIAELSSNYRVIAYSRRHHWPNPEPGEDFNPSMVTQAEDLAALLRSLKLGPAHLIGHSAGANIALLVAQSHPDLVASLVLAEPGPALTPRNPASPAAGPPPFIVQATEAFRAGEHERAIRVIVAGVVGGEAEPVIADEYMRVFLDNVPVTKAQLTAANRTPPPLLTCEQAGQIEAPALLMNGEASPSVFHAVAGQLLGCLRAVEPVTIPDAGHGLYLQNPAAFREAVLAFLEEHASAEGFAE
jgi:non-heme chloroperoxidase